MSVPVIQTKNKLFFSNLNGVRTIAASLVVVSHIELHKASFGIGQIPGVNLTGLGKVGVSIFFSLSGFLITYLLLEEKQNFKKVNFKDFYMRRILRIWPLYFLVIVCGFFIYPGAGSSQALWLSVFFLPNVAFMLNRLPVIFDPIWSIGIEEQFYIFHPHFFRIKKLRNLLHCLVLFIVFFIVLFIVMRYFDKGNPQGEQMVSRFFYYARYDNMMVGAIVAILYFNTKNKIFRFKFQRVFDALFGKAMQLTLLLALIGFIGLYITYTIQLGDMVIATLAAVLIANLCETDSSIYSLKGGAFQFSGRISYGIYLLHKFPLFLVLYLVKKYTPDTPFVVKNIMIYGATFLLTISLAAASYYGYERYFLTLKKRFQKVPNNIV